MRSSLRKLARDVRGTTAVEYALILGVMAAVWTYCGDLLVSGLATLFDRILDAVR